MKNGAENHECPGSRRRSPDTDAVSEPRPGGRQGHRSAQKRQQTRSNKTALVPIVAADGKILINIVDADYGKNKPANQKHGRESAESPGPIDCRGVRGRLVRIQQNEFHTQPRDGQDSGKERDQNKPVKKDVPEKNGDPS